MRYFLVLILIFAYNFSTAQFGYEFWPLRSCVLQMDEHGIVCKKDLPDKTNLVLSTFGIGNRDGNLALYGSVRKIINAEDNRILYNTGERMGFGFLVQDFNNENIFHYFYSSEANFYSSEPKICHIVLDILANGEYTTKPNEFVIPEPICFLHIIPDYFEQKFWLLTIPEKRNAINIYTFKNDEIQLCNQYFDDVINDVQSTLDANTAYNSTFDKLYAHLENHNSIVCFDFDVNNGKIISNKIYHNASRCAVSKSGKYLFTIVSDASSNISFIRYNLSDDGGISGQKIYEIKNYQHEYLPAMKLALDGNIYVLLTSYSRLDCITNIDGDTPIYKTNVMSLNSGEKGFAFPNQLFLTPHISCKHDDCFRSFSFSYFSFSEGCGLLWDFGDNTEQSTETSPVHVYEKSGKYTVKLTVTFSSGETKTLEKNLVVNPPLEKPKIIVE